MRALRLALPWMLVFCLLPAAAQDRPPVRFQTKYERVVPGMVANSTYVLQYRSDDLRLEVRDLIMGRGTARDIPTPSRALMELRGGSVTTDINGKKTKRTQGDMWNVAKGDRLSIQNPHDVAVIRSMSIIERGR